MTLNLWPRGQQQRQRTCPNGAHSWVVRQFRGSSGFRNLEICEHCGRTHVLLQVDDGAPRTPVHAAVAA